MRPYEAPEQLADLHFPVAGVDLSAAFVKQPNRDVGGGVYARTCAVGLNVRGYEASTLRRRGGSRAGLAKYIATPLVADWIVQEVSLLVGVGYAPPGGTMQLSQSGRIVTIVAVSQGNVFTANAGDAAWSAATNSTGDTPPLNFSGVVFSSANNQKLWFADGINWVYYDPSVNTVKRWAASAGQLPQDSDKNTPRLIATWRGRTVLSGLLKDPQNVFFSAVSDPTDFDYSPQSVTPTQAVALNLSPLGLIGDVVTSLCPYTDDVLVVFGDHTVYMMRGDPMAGGQIDLISDSIGGSFGVCWCKDPYGNIYFFSNKCGIYSLVPGQAPQRISQAIEQLLLPIDTGNNSIRLVWDDHFQGLHVFVTPLAAPAASTHFFYEQRTGGWWTDQFANSNLDPVAVCLFDGNTPGDRAVLIGSWDGFVRTISPTATTDDGTAIATDVVIGPMNSKDLDEILAKDIQAVLGGTSGTVNYAIYVGASAEVALASTPAASGVWAAGRNLTNFVRRSGHAIYVRLTSSNPWSMEQIRFRLASTGKVRRRGV